MHKEALDFVRRNRHAIDVLEFGSYNVNGGVRELFAGCNFLGVDVRPGPGVDIVADAATFDSKGRLFDVIVCTEVFEHAKDWRLIIAKSFYLLRDGGKLIITAAGPGRQKHSVDGSPALAPGEWYENIDPVQLQEKLGEYFSEVYVETLGQDVRAIARLTYAKIDRITITKD